MDDAATLHPTHPTAEMLAGRLPEVRLAPADAGTLELIVARPAVDQRSVLAEAELHPDHGLVGDNWADRPSSRDESGEYRYDTQLNIMSARAVAAVAGDPERRALAGRCCSSRKLKRQSPSKSKQASAS
jgi:hypothetical protein